MVRPDYCAIDHLRTGLVRGPESIGLGRHHREREWLSQSSAGTGLSLPCFTCSPFHNRWSQSPRMSPGPEMKRGLPKWLNTSCWRFSARRSCATTGARNSLIAACFNQLAARPLGVKNRAKGVNVPSVADVKIAVTQRVSLFFPSQRVCTVTGV